MKVILSAVACQSCGRNIEDETMRLLRYERPKKFVAIWD